MLRNSLYLAFITSREKCKFVICHFEFLKEVYKDNLKTDIDKNI